jgi:hypothetical protein
MSLANRGWEADRAGTRLRSSDLADHDARVIQIGAASSSLRAVSPPSPRVLVRHFYEFE